MDTIQKVLVKAGRKDLAQKYYLKTKAQKEEFLDIRELSSGFLRDPKTLEKVYSVTSGRIPVKLKDGQMYKVEKVLRADQIQKGQIVAAFYNSVNQGFDIYEILGFTDIEEKYGEGGVKFNSAKELYQQYKVTSLKALENKQQEIAKKKFGKDWYGHSSYLTVKDLNDGDSGAWFYISNGKWSVGSGAEPLSFRLMKKV